ncbi:MAG: ABC-2 family transporter protein [Parachlamydiaceae bacterium]|nr:ABC-2 family transporter protein [Parachlamydiaceae bacterium]
MAIAIIPLCYFLVEAAFWSGLIKASGNDLLAGFPARYYLGYCLYLVLQLGSVNWRFERAMISEINTGAVNALLLRPSSFFEYHLGLLLGQKLITAFVMVPIIVLIARLWDLPLYIERLPIVLLMGVCYVTLLFSLHFAVAAMAFFFNHVYSLNNTKNMIIWFLTGELMPLDLLPSPIREWVIALPFSCGVYLPAAYLSGRIESDVFLRGFISLAFGGVFFGLIARLAWKQGLKRYSGTGA